ncbi:hypothetical protein D3C81_1679730 [compost metagenome]
MTSSSTVLTLEFSRVCCCTTPKPLRPGVPICGAPLAAVSRNRLLPMACRPAGLMKSAVWMLPMICAAGLPAVVIDTVPSWPTVNVCASGGTTIAGSRAKPLAVTIWPSEFRWKVPSRLYETVPSGCRIWKKPRPLTAMSNGFSVVCRLPVLKFFWVPTMRTPVPTCRPDGSSLSWVDWAPG